MGYFRGITETDQPFVVPSQWHDNWLYHTETKTWTTELFLDGESYATATVVVVDNEEEPRKWAWRFDCPTWGEQAGFAPSFTEAIEQVEEFKNEFPVTETEKQDDDA